MRDANGPDQAPIRSFLPPGQSYRCLPALSQADTWSQDDASTLGSLPEPRRKQPVCYILITKQKHSFRIPLKRDSAFLNRETLKEQPSCR